MKLWIPVIVAALSIAGNALTGLVANGKQDAIYDLRFTILKLEAEKLELAGKLAELRVQRRGLTKAGRTAPVRGLNSEMVAALAEADSTVRPNLPRAPQQTWLRRTTTRVKR
jgi:predicted nucleic acid-binding protein